MNLKFTEDMYKTYSDMKSGLYILTWLAGIHTVTFTFYLLYKNFIRQDNDNDNDNDNGRLPRGLNRRLLRG